MTVRIGLLGSGFVSNFYMLGLQDVAGWEIPVVASPNAGPRPAVRREVEHSRSDRRRRRRDRPQGSRI